MLQGWRAWAVAAALVGPLGLQACQVNLPVRGPTEEVYIGNDSATLSSMSNLPWEQSFEIITKNRNHIKGKRTAGGAWQITVNRKEASASYAANLVRQTEVNDSNSKKGEKDTKEQILEWLDAAGGSSGPLGASASNQGAGG